MKREKYRLTTEDFVLGNTQEAPKNPNNVVSKLLTTKWNLFLIFFIVISF